MALTTQNIKLKFTGIVINTGDGGIRCIKSFPDIDTSGNPDQVEITTLCDEYHQYIDGLKNYADDLEFTANYDELVFSTLNSISEYNPSSEYGIGDVCRKDGVIYVCNSNGTTGVWDNAEWDACVVELLLCESQSDVAGKNGKFSIAKADIQVRLSGAGVGDVLEMVYIVKPKSAITFSAVA